MKKTLKAFFENCEHPELYKKAWKQGGVDWKTYKENPGDYYAANTGAVTGMVYHKDTVPFARKNHFLILQALQRFNEETGSALMPPTKSETQYYNWLSWFAWESMAGDLQNYLEY